MTENSKPHKYDKFIPWYFVSFFLFLFVVDGTLFYLATSTHTGVVDKNYYESGLNYNKTLADEKLQEKLGWKSDITLKENNMLTVFLSDLSGKPVKQAKISAVIFRPTQDGHDFEATLNENQNNYTVKLDFPLNGSWEVRITATKDDDKYKSNKRIVVK